MTLLLCRLIGGDGEDIAPNKARAAFFLRKASDQGHLEASVLYAEIMRVSITCAECV